MTSASFNTPPPPPPKRQNFNAFALLPLGFSVNFKTQLCGKSNKRLYLRLGLLSFSNRNDEVFLQEEVFLRMLFCINANVRLRTTLLLLWLPVLLKSRQFSSVGHMSEIVRFCCSGRLHYYDVKNVWKNRLARCICTSEETGKIVQIAASSPSMWALMISRYFQDK